MDFLGLITAANLTMSPPDFDAQPTNVSVLLQIATSEAVAINTPVICFICIIVFMGIVGNGLVIWTYCRRIHVSSTNLFIFSLSILDFTSCSLGLSAEVFDLLNPYTNDVSYLCAFHKFISFTGDLAAGCVIVCISFDRYLRIARPHQGLSIRYSRICVSAVCIASIIISSLCLFIYGSRPIMTNTIPPVMGVGCGTSLRARKTPVPLIFSTIILICFLVGFCLLLTVYIRLGIKVHHWYKTRSGKQDKSDRGIKPSKRTKSTFSDESSSKLESKDPSTPYREAQTFEFPNIETDDKCFQTGISDLSVRPGYVRQLSKSLDKNSFFNIDAASDERTRTLPSPKSPSVRTDVASRPLRKEPSAANSFSVFRRRMKLSKTTIMFITAAVAYFVCHVPYACVKVVFLLYPKYTLEISDVSNSLLKFAEYSYSISYVANPVIYSFMNPNFRKECRSLMKSIKSVLSCRRLFPRQTYDF